MTRRERRRAVMSPRPRSCFGPTRPVYGQSGSMASPILLCTEGSDATLGALSAGLQLLGRDSEMVLVMVMDAPDEGALAGSGHAGPEVSVQEFDNQVAQAREATNTATGTVQSELGLKNADIRILTGEPGLAICNSPQSSRPKRSWSATGEEAG